MSWSINMLIQLFWKWRRETLSSFQSQKWNHSTHKELTLLHSLKWTCLAAYLLKDALQRVGFFCGKLYEMLMYHSSLFDHYSLQRNIFKQTVAFSPPMVQFSFLLGSGIWQETSICPHSWALTSRDLCSPLELRLSAYDFYLHGCVPRPMGAPAKAAPDDFVTYKKFLICEMGAGVAAHLESVILSLSPWLTQLLPTDRLITVYDAGCLSCKWSPDRSSDSWGRGRNETRQLKETCAESPTKSATEAEVVARRVQTRTSPPVSHQKVIA